MKKLNVVDFNDEGANHLFRYGGTYLHGELEDEIGYDIFCFDRETDFTEGAHEVLIEGTGRVATFFLWKSPIENWGWRGLLVYNDDADFDYCNRQFKDRVDCL